MNCFPPTEQAGNRREFFRGAARWLFSGLVLAAAPVREDARDALILRPDLNSSPELPEGAVIGTGSVRRQAQILAQRRDLIAKDIRGNVGTGRKGRRD